MTQRLKSYFPIMIVMFIVSCKSTQNIPVNKPPIIPRESKFEEGETYSCKDSINYKMYCCLLNKYISNFEWKTSIPHPYDNILLEEGGIVRLEKVVNQLGIRKDSSNDVRETLMRFIQHVNIELINQTSNTVNIDDQVVFIMTTVNNITCFETNATAIHEVLRFLDIRYTYDYSKLPKGHSHEWSTAYELYITCMRNLVTKYTPEHSDQLHPYHELQWEREYKSDSELQRIFDHHTDYLVYRAKEIIEKFDLKNKIIEAAKKENK